MKQAKNIRDEYDFSKGTRGAVITHHGKTRITIWIDTDILEWFRSEAEREGVGYQTAMNQSLRDFVRQGKRPLEEIVREAVRLELKHFRRAS